jgi:hypothetical protein
LASAFPARRFCRCRRHFPRTLMVMCARQRCTRAGRFQAECDGVAVTLSSHHT